MLKVSAASWLHSGGVTGKGRGRRTGDGALADGWRLCAGGALECADELELVDGLEAEGALPDGDLELALAGRG